MALLAVEMNRTASASLSVGNVIADATRPRRGVFYYLEFGSDGTVGDNVFLWQVQRCTTAGTATSVTPQLLDPADAATESDAGENHTIDPTLTAGAILLSVPLNQRATFQWQTLPEFGFVYPASASNGLAVRTPTAGGAVAITATVHYREN